MKNASFCHCVLYGPPSPCRRQKCRAHAQFRKTDVPLTLSGGAFCRRVNEAPCGMFLLDLDSLHCVDMLDLVELW